MPARFFGTLLGAILGLALSIAYNTSSNVAALEGGHGHLAFKATLIAAAVGAAVGFVLTHLLISPRAVAPPSKPTGEQPADDDA